LDQNNLCLDICKKCLGDTEWERITRSDELLYNFFYCKAGTAKLYKPAPERCPYLLEHVLETQRLKGYERKIMNGKFVMIPHNTPEDS
jgi:hypothetical protein